MLTVPPLRERPKDLPLLVEHFRREVNARHRLAIEGLTPGAQRRLAVYRWPGNVCELDAVLEEAMILKGEGSIRPQDLTLEEAIEGADVAANPFEGREPIVV